MINYKHLHYFWSVAKEGGIARASERLNLTPQTISGQLSVLEDYLGLELFNRVGRNLELTENGRLILSYADEIFSLGGELEEMVHQLPHDRPMPFRVGVVDVVPKSIAHRILRPATQVKQPIRILCREASLDKLLADLAVHRLDLVLADREIPATVNSRGYSHKLGESSISFFATQTLKDRLSGSFPQCLNGAPILLPSKGNQLRTAIDQWFDKHRIHPHIVAEFDDSALMKVFGQEDVGIFIAPSVIENELVRHCGAYSIGQVAEVKEHFYAIAVERKISHPLISTILEAARESLFANV